jgi:hypothetical protein
MNNKRRIALSVVGFRYDRIGFSVEGRCLESPIRLGDIFTLMVPNWGGDRHEEQTIHLKINSIIMADRFDLKKLDRGVSAELRLSGTGANLVRERCHLIGEMEDSVC